MSFLDRLGSRLAAEERGERVPPSPEVLDAYAGLLDRSGDDWDSATARECGEDAIAFLQTGLSLGMNFEEATAWAVDQWAGEWCLT